MGALDCGMAGDQLPGAVPVADTTPAADDMNATPEQSVLEVEGVKAGATCGTAAPVHEFEDQTTRPGDVGELIHDVLVDHRPAGHHFTGGAGGHGRLKAACDVTARTLPEPRRSLSRHLPVGYPARGTSVRVIA
jgi:hypothetical protein